MSTSDKAVTTPSKELYEWDQIKYDDLKLSELKELCEEKGLTGKVQKPHNHKASYIKVLRADDEKHTNHTRVNFTLSPDAKGNSSSPK